MNPFCITLLLTPSFLTLFHIFFTFTILTIFRESFLGISSDNTTVIEMGLYQGIVNVMQYFWQNKRLNTPYGANAGGNLFG